MQHLSSVLVFHLIATSLSIFATQNASMHASKSRLNVVVFKRMTQMWLCSKQFSGLFTYKLCFDISTNDIVILKRVFAMGDAVIYS